ncbi:AraC family transcriptional regulator [Paenibacillus sp. CAU 1782]
MTQYGQPESPQQVPGSIVTNEFAGAVRHVCRDKLTLPPSNMHIVLLVESGMGTLLLNGQKYPLASGKCFYGLPGMAISVEPYFNEAVVYAVSFNRLGSRVEQDEQIIFARLREGFADWGALSAPRPERLLQLADELVRLKPASEQIHYSLAVALFHDWMHELSSANSPRSDQSDGNEAVIQKIADYIRSHYHEDLKRGVLSKKAGFTPEYFSALFKQVTGKSLTEFITELRIRHIQERLLFGGARLLEAAREVGYKDEHYASRRFKQEVGVSPTSYIRSPKKIVSLSPHLTLHLLALGIAPAATLAYPWRFGEYETVLSEGGCLVRDSAVGFSQDELAALRPDIILAIDNLEKSKIEACRTLAPTLVVPWYGSDWRGHFSLLAGITGREEQKRLWLQDFGQRGAILKERLQASVSLKRTLLIVNIRNTSSYLYLNRGMGSQVVYGELGFHAPLEVQKLSLDGASFAIQLEDILPRFTADVILLITEPSPQAAARTGILLKEEAWIQYVRNGGIVHQADMSRWHGYDPLSNQRQLEDMENWFGL